MAQKPGCEIPSDGTCFSSLLCGYPPGGRGGHFKTDNTPLFTWSKGVLADEGWELQHVTCHLHENGVTGIMTDYEAKFVAEGVAIKRLEALKTDSTKDTSAGTPPRLRNAALSDARNC